MCSPPPTAAHQGQDWVQTPRGRRPERPITAPGIPARADAVVCGPSSALGGALTGSSSARAPAPLLCPAPLPAPVRTSSLPRRQRSPRPAPPPGLRPHVTWEAPSQLLGARGYTFPFAVFLSFLKAGFVGPPWVSAGVRAALSLQ